MNQISNCFDTELKQHLEYELKQEALKLESYSKKQNIEKNFWKSM